DEQPQKHAEIHAGLATTKSTKSTKKGTRGKGKCTLDRAEGTQDLTTKSTKSIKNGTPKWAMWKGGTQV
ncbi:MAG: hypothetical protein ACI4QJ_09145, partial [Candidatus Spyradenecus sp.]